MVRSNPTRHRRRFGAIAATLGLLLALPAASLGAGHGFRTAEASYITPTSSTTTVIPLLTVGENAGVPGFTFEGIPDGIGIAPVQGRGSLIDVYVAHEQSTVPFPPDTADHQDASVSRLRVDVSNPMDPAIVDASVPLGPEEGYLRFCSAFMAGPEHGFPHHTFLLNEEADSIVPVPAGAQYGPDPGLAPGMRQSGFAVYLDTRTGKYDNLPNQGRHNHENTVIVPGGWKNTVAALSGDDTFTFPSTEDLPNLSQLYMGLSQNWRQFQKDNSTLWAFRITGTDGGPVNPADPFNDANDYFEINTGDNWTGEFIPVPGDVARGETNLPPQEALERWSNENNVFQFIRVEDIAYDLRDPRVVYVADTGNSRLRESDTTGRLWRTGSSDPAPKMSSNGRIFQLVMNASDPTKVDSFSVLADAADVGFAKPDNIDTSGNSLMVQEDNDNARVWRYDLWGGGWSVVATVTADPTGESSGIVDASKYLGPGWWILDVQAHGIWQETFPPRGDVVNVKREDGQLLLMHVPGS